jgi:hypothetical protein
VAETTYTDKAPVRLFELTKEIANVVNQHFADRFYWVIAEITAGNRQRIDHG